MAAATAASSANAAPGVDAASVDPGGVTAAASDPAQTYETEFYDPIHTAEQNFIDNPADQSFINSINSLDPNQLLIGNGADGVDGGTLAQATGGDGGLIFGDGGNGATDAAGVGGAGGAASDGDGGDGGSRARWRFRRGWR